MFVTDRHSLTRNFEMFAVCSSQTAKQIDGFSALGAGKKQRNKSPPQAPLSTTWCVCKSFSCTETPPESATNCGQPTSTRQRADRELAGTSSRRATCRPPSAARAESTAASARLHGAESIEHLGADRRGPVRGADRAGARCSAACDCQNAFSSFCSRRKVNGKKVGTQRPAQPHRGAPLVLRFLPLYLVPEEKA